MTEKTLAESAAQAKTVPMFSSDQHILGLMHAVTNGPEPMTEEQTDRFFESILTMLLDRKKRKEVDHG